MSPVGSIWWWAGPGPGAVSLLLGTLQGWAGLSGTPAGLPRRGPGREVVRWHRVWWLLPTLGGLGPCQTAPGSTSPSLWVRTAVLPSDMTPRMPSEGSRHQGRVQERARGRARRDLAACPVCGNSESASPAWPPSHRPALGVPTRLPARSALWSPGSEVASAVPIAGGLPLWTCCPYLPSPL